VPRGFVEFARVPHHIHVTHMITLPGIHHTPGRDQQFGGSFIKICGTHTLQSGRTVAHTTPAIQTNGSKTLIRLWGFF
jgi:hypothetical protein